MKARTFLVHTILPIVIGVMLVVGVMVFLVNNPFQEELHPQLSASFKQYNAAAQLHQSRMGSYDGLCADMVYGESVTCVADTTQFVMYEFISPKEGYYCTDSLGFRGAVPTISTKIRCQL